MRFVKMTKRIFVFCVFISVSFMSSAQTWNDFGFGCGFNIPIQKIDYHEVNNLLVQNGYPEADFSPLLEFEISGYWNRLTGTLFSISAGTLNSDYGEISEDKKTWTKSNTAKLSTNIGYSIIKRPFLNFYPYLGFQYYGMKYIFMERFTSNEICLENYLESKLDYKDLKYTRIYFDLGLSFSVLPKVRIDNFSGRSYFGIKSGYLLPLGHGKWVTYEQKNRDLTFDAPKITCTYYFILTFGLLIG